MANSSAVPHPYLVQSPEPQHSVIAGTGQQGALAGLVSTAVDVCVAVTLHGCLCGNRGDRREKLKTCPYI